MGVLIQKMCRGLFISLTLIIAIFYFVSPDFYLNNVKYTIILLLSCERVKCCRNVLYESNIVVILNLKISTKIITIYTFQTVMKGNFIKV